MTETQKQRIDRIIAEATSKPPKRIYHDDAIWLTDIIVDLLCELEKQKLQNMNLRDELAALQK